MPKKQRIVQKKTKKEQEKEKETEAENERFLRISTFLEKMETNHFQIRKPLNEIIREELEEFGHKTYFQRVFILASNISGEKLEHYCRNSSFTVYDLHHPDYREYLQHHLDKIFTTCEKQKSSSDHLSGFCIVMGDGNTCLMIEGPEDMVAIFFDELNKIHDNIWSNSKVVLVEDKIKGVYFNCFYSRRSAAININEKFPTSTPGDFNLMAVHHLKIKEKLKSLVECLSNELTKSDPKSIESKKVPSFIEEPEPQETALNIFMLPSEPYNKLLPEIQRIDLILNANKFYQSVKDFALTYKIIPTHPDEDSLFWPIQDNYMPLDIFERSEFDVNLTFGNYGKEEEKKKPETEDHNEEELEAKS